MNEIIIQNWLENKIHNKSIGNYLGTYSYKKVAIYGIGKLGELLYKELETSSIGVVAFLTNNHVYQYFMENTVVVRLDDFLKTNVIDASVDAIIVTQQEDYETVLLDTLATVPWLPVVSLKDIIYEM